MKARSLWFVLALITLASSASFAQFKYEGPRWTVAPLVGYETSGSYPIDTSSDLGTNSTVDRVRIDGGLTYGVAVDRSFSENFAFEFLWMENPSQYSVHDYYVDHYFKAYNSRADQFQFGALVHLKGADSKWRPYIAGGLGFTHETNDGADDRNAFAFNVGGGVEYMVTKRFGFRGDARYMPTYGNSSVGVTCDYFGYCYQANVRNYEHRGNFTGGLVFKF